MFETRQLPDDIRSLAEELAPSVQVLDAPREFETMPEDWLYELALITENVRSLSYPSEWVPNDAPPAALRTTGRDPAIGMPDDGSVAWTRQTDPPLVFVKPRAESVPTAFRDFLIAEAIVETGAGYPETPICFFREEYAAVHDFADSPIVAFQLAGALRRGWVGRQTRGVFEAWEEAYPRLHDAWADTGQRLEERVASIPELRREGRLGFADATELACNAIKHGIEIPTPFAALDVEAFTAQGAPFARHWLEQTTAVD